MVAAIWFTFLPLLNSLLLSYWLVATEPEFRPSYILLLAAALPVGGVLALALLPTTLVSLASGWLFGWQAVPMLLLSYLLAVRLGLAVGQFIGKRFVSSLLQRYPRLVGVQQALKQQLFSTTAWMRLSPVLPFALGNFLLSLTRSASAEKLPLAPILAGSLLGMVPRTLLAVWAGSKAANLQQAIANESSSTTENAIVLVLLLASTYALGRVSVKLWRVSGGGASPNQ